MERPLILRPLILRGSLNAPDFTEVALRYNAPAQSAWMMTAKRHRKMDVC